jgi:hypothetical protein
MKVKTGLKAGEGEGTGVGIVSQSNSSKVAQRID